MPARRVAVSVALALFAALPAPALADPSGMTISAGLNGQRERPERGDPNGSGSFRMTVDQVTGTLCYELTVRNIAPATAAHIHVAGRDAPGPVVQPLQPPSDGHSSGCATNAGLAAALAADPSNYYVNVHNGEFPAGAVRGQLAGG